MMRKVPGAETRSDFLCAEEQKRQVFSLEGSGSADYANDGSLLIRFVRIGCLDVSDDIRGKRSRLQMP